MKHTQIRENKNAENSTTSGQYANSYVASRTFFRIDPEFQGIVVLRFQVDCNDSSVVFVPINGSPVYRIVIPAARCFARLAPARCNRPTDYMVVYAIRRQFRGVRRFRGFRGSPGFFRDYLPR